MNVVNFPPLGEFELPEYESQKLALPPLLEVIEYLEREQYAELIISTPGPMGFVALAAARLLGLRTAGIYHTDFPRYVRHLTQDESMVRTTAWFMQWFYGQMDTVIVPSEYYRNHLIEHGLHQAATAACSGMASIPSCSIRASDSPTSGAAGDSKAVSISCTPAGCREKRISMCCSKLSSSSKRAGRGVNLIIAGTGPLRLAARRALAAAAAWCSPAGCPAKNWPRPMPVPMPSSFPARPTRSATSCSKPRPRACRRLCRTAAGRRRLCAAATRAWWSTSRIPALWPMPCGVLASGAGLEPLKRRALENARDNSWQKIFEMFWNFEPAEVPPPEPSIADELPLAMDIA